MGAAHPFLAASFAKAEAESSCPSLEDDEDLPLPPFGEDDAVLSSPARVLVSDMTDLAAGRAAVNGAQEQRRGRGHSPSSLAATASAAAGVLSALVAVGAVCAALLLIVCGVCGVQVDEEELLEELDYLPQFRPVFMRVRPSRRALYHNKCTRPDRPLTPCPR